MSSDDVYGFVSHAARKNVVEQSGLLHARANTSKSPFNVWLRQCDGVSSKSLACGQTHAHILIYVAAVTSTSATAYYHTINTNPYQQHRSIPKATGDSVTEPQLHSSKARSNAPVSNPARPVTILLSSPRLSLVYSVTLQHATPLSPSRQMSNNNINVGTPAAAGAATQTAPSYHVAQDALGQLGHCHRCNGTYCSTTDECESCVAYKVSQPKIQRTSLAQIEAAATRDDPVEAREIAQ